MLNLRLLTSLEKPCVEAKKETVTFQPSDLAGSWLVCGRVKHSVIPVHGDKRLLFNPSLARSLWAWTKISKDQSSHCSALSPDKSREM